MRSYEFAFRVIWYGVLVAVIYGWERFLLAVNPELAKVNKHQMVVGAVGNSFAPFSMRRAASAGVFDYLRLIVLNSGRSASPRAITGRDNMHQRPS